MVILSSQVLKNMKSLRFLATSIISFGISAAPILANHVPTHYTTSDCVKSTLVPYANIGHVMGAVFSFVLVFASILVFCYFLLGGVQWMTSGGDKQAAQAAKDRLTAALVGLLIILSVWGVARITEAAFGVSILSGIKLPFGVPSPFKGGSTCV